MTVPVERICINHGPLLRIEGTQSEIDDLLDDLQAGDTPQLVVDRANKYDAKVEIQSVV